MEKNPTYPNPAPPTTQTKAGEQGMISLVLADLYTLRCCTEVSHGAGALSMHSGTRGAGH